MSVAFQCPSCLRKLYYENGDTPFQVCFHCKGKIIVPSTVVHQVEIKEERPTEYALREQRDRKLAEIQSELNAGRKIEAIKTFRETFGADLRTAKEAIDRLEANKKVKIAREDLRENFSALQESIAPKTSAQTNLTQTGEPPKIGQLIMTLIYIAIGVAVFFWFME
jgi:ribosomal protein L7/L12